MITDGEKWHYLALKSILTNDGYMRPTQTISRLFNKITSNHNGDYYCLNCFIHIVLWKNLKNLN